MTTIIVTHEDNEVDEFEFDSDHNTISIGRRSSNDVCVPNLSVSGNHAQIVIEGSTARLEDLNSTNGTYINGQSVTRQPLEDGDEIIIGKIRIAFLHTAEIVETVANTHATNDSANIAGAQAANTESVLADKQNQQNTDQPASAAAPVMAAASHVTASSVAASPVTEGHEPAARMVSDFGDGHHAHGDELDPLSMNDANVGHTEPPVADASSTPHPLDGVERFPVQADADKPPMHELDSTPATSKGAVIEIKNGAKSGQILPIDKPVTTLGRPGIQIAAIMRKPDGYFLMHIESDDSVDRPTLNQDVIGDEPVLLHSGDELNVAGIDVEFMLS